MASGLQTVQDTVISPQLHRHEKDLLVAGSPAEAECALFHHVPLDSETQTIRLIQIQPAQTQDEQVRCNINIASVDTPYFCLSYVWGASDNGRWILLNGRRMWVRQNLYDFLHFARQMPPLRSRWIWIDALCIDQTNLSERQHQVQQMGCIFSEAAEVIAWLGNNDDIATFLATGLLPSNTRCTTPPYLFRSLVDSPYWQRAWITQEIVLAPHVTFMAGHTVLPLEFLPHYIQDSSAEYTKFLQFLQILRPESHADTTTLMTTKSSMYGRSLIWLLNNYSHMRCQIPRDRIFSLLALCGEGSDIEVDYSISDLDLMSRVMYSCKQALCLCSIMLVAEALLVRSELRYGDVPCSFTQLPGYADLTLPIVRAPEVDAWSPMIAYDLRNKRHCPVTSTILCGHFDEHGMPTWIVVWICLGEICNASDSYVYIRINPANIGFAFQHIDNWHAPRPQNLRTWRNQFNVHLTAHSNFGTIRLPLSFWLDMTAAIDKRLELHINTASLRKFTGCCSRVTNPDNNGVAREQGPVPHFALHCGPSGIYGQ